jgi:chitinase
MMTDLMHRTSLTALGLLLAIFAQVIGATTKVADAKEPEKVFVGYLFGRPSKINYGLYTHICHAFLVADEDGKIRTGRTVPSRDITGQAHLAGVNVLVSLGGWGWDKQFAAIVSKSEAEDRYIKSVLEIVDRFDYDGIDLDWEYPDTREEVVGFERLVRRFRKELDVLGQKKGRRMAMTMAVSSNAGTLQWLGKEVLLETMDWLNVMTYDFAGPWTSYAGHNSPLHASSKQPDGKPRSTESTMKYLVDERGLPPNRLAVGIPLYGRGFAVAEPYASTKSVPRTRVPGGNYSNLQRLQKEGWTRRWDEETKTPWLIAPDKSAVIGYDDAESVAIKTEWAMKHGFRGVFFWQIGADLLPDGTNPLQESAHHKMPQRPGEKAKS